ncbi:replication P family protein [Pseudomonas frederiksbergensis]|uniref:Replication P family protein n=1 Tax=Pseudomonas frederiksbergensis TaxID=104087 RepID=A0A423KIC4_9PSED|nr:replication protein P [Pseudomonas frederiksbergensis]RON52905.1 replication P family protein [Pseudomonas frederiksbergensis]
MRTVTTVAAQAMTKVRHGEFIESTTDVSVQTQQDQARETGKVINQLFRQMRSIRTAWRQAWPDKKAYMESKATWLQAFIENGICTQEQIDIGLMRCRAEPSDFIPSVGKFIQGCVPTPEMLSPPLPSVEVAYKQALRNCHPTMHGVAKWFHPAVYHATAAAGFNSLPLLSRELGLISFEKRYMEQVRKVWRGEQLGPVPVAELAGPAPERTPDVGNQALAALRAMRSRGTARA